MSLKCLESEREEISIKKKNTTPEEELALYWIVIPHLFFMCIFAKYL